MPRKELVGRVIRAKMQKTVVVEVEWVQHHPLYKKALRRTTRLYAHDPLEKCREGDLVRVMETRPLSRLKRWLVKEVLQRGEVVEVKPEEAAEAPPAEGAGETPSQGESP